MTALVSGWMRGAIPNYGMILRSDEYNPESYKSFCSLNYDPAVVSCSQESRQPTLTINYNTPPTMPVGLGQSPSTCFDGGMPRVTSLQPALTATARDVDTGGSQNLGSAGANPERGHEAIRMRFEIWPEGSAEFVDPTVAALSVVASGTSPWVQQGTPARWTVPTGVLSEGGSYVWRAIADDGASLSTMYSEWRAFTVDTSLQDQGQCPAVLLDTNTQATAALALEGMVDDESDVFAGVETRPDGSVALLVVPRQGQTEVAAVDAAAAAATDVITSEQNDLSAQEEASVLGTMSIATAVHTQGELQGVVDEINARYDAKDGSLPYLLSWGIDPSANVVDVAVADLNSAEAAAMKVKYGARVSLRQDNPEDSPMQTSRGIDSSPYSGGATLRFPEEGPYGSRCTAGFPLSGRLGTSYLATTGHCTGEDGFGQPVQNGSTRIGTVKEAWNRAALDGLVVEAYSNASFSNKIYVNDSRRVRIAFGATLDPKGGKVCRSGSTTGRFCGLVIQDPKPKCYTFGRHLGPFGGTRHCDMILVKRLDGGPATRKGDSGGPVFTEIQSGRYAGEVHLVGMIVGGNSQDDDQGNLVKAGDRLYYQPIRTFLRELNERSTECYVLRAAVQQKCYKS